MISRVAEHCFWMSRYLERAENTARILDVNQAHLLDTEVPRELQWRPLLIISGIHDDPCELEAESVQAYMTWEQENPCSVVATLGYARENARIIREVISAEMWERINYYYLWLHSPLARELYESNRSEFYNQIRRINQLVHGIADGTMTHGEPWEFFQFGKYLERACQTARILDVKYHILLPSPEHVGTAIDHAHWVAILTSCSGYEAFHKKVRLAADFGVAVAEFLIFDPQFPRSVLCCVAECRKSAYAIAGREPSTPHNDVEAFLGELEGWLRAINITQVIRIGLHETLTRVVNRTHDIGEAVHRTYFDAPIFERMKDEG